MEFAQMIFMFFVIGAIGGINGIGFNGLTGVYGIIRVVDVSGGSDIIGKIPTSEGQHVTGADRVTLIMGTVGAYDTHFSK